MKAWTVLPVLGVMISPIAYAQAADFSPPKTSWGVPDLQGYWNNTSLTSMQRPSTTNKLVLTEQEAISLARKVPVIAATREESVASKVDEKSSAELLADKNPDRGYNTFWMDPGASYAQEWLATARELARPLPERASGIGALVDPADALGPGQGVGEPASVATMPLEALRDALVDPLGTWLRDALGLRLWRERPPPDDAEPLWTDGDDRGLVQACVDRLLVGDEDGRVVGELAIAPQTAAGAPGRLHAESAVRRARALVAEAMSGVGSSAARTASRMGSSRRVHWRAWTACRR